MSRKMKILIPVLVAVLLLTVGGTAVVMADEEPLPQTGPLSLLARVAGILGIEQEKLVDAFGKHGRRCRRNGSRSVSSGARRIRRSASSGRRGGRIALRIGRI